MRSYESKRPYCPLGVYRCAFDYVRIKKNLDNARRTVARARRAVVDTVRCNGLDHLLTMTSGKAFKTRAEMLDAWSGYLNDKQYGRWFAEHLHHCYESVAEPFEDGNGWHIHTGIRGRLPGPVLMRLKVTWTRYLRDRHGIEPPSVRSGLWRVNVRPPKRGHTLRSLGLYLAEYVGKAFDEVGPREHRHRRGLGMAGPVKSSAYVEWSWEEVRAAFLGFPEWFEIKHPVTGEVIGWTSERDGP